MRSNIHDVEVIYQTRTDRAVCVRETEDGEDIWVPLSVCEIAPRDGGLVRGCVATLTAEEPILTEKGLI